MSKPNTVCRVCGKEYYCCNDSRNINSWRAMACSPECYKEYMRRIKAARDKSITSFESASSEKSIADKIKVRKKKTEQTEIAENANEDINS